MESKSQNLLINILSSLFIVIFFYLTNNQNIFLYVFSFSLIKIYEALLSNISIEKPLKKYFDLGEIQTALKIKNYSVILLLGLTLLLSAFNYFLGIILNIYLEIKFLPETFFIASLTLGVKPILRFTSTYLELTGRHKLVNNINYLFQILSTSIFLLNTILFFRLFKLDNLIGIYALLTSPIFAILIIYLFLMIFNKKKYNLKLPSKTPKVNYRMILREALHYKFDEAIIKSLLNSFNYLSILFIYYTLYHLYHYDYIEISNLVDLTYFYALNVVLVIAYIAYYMINKKIRNLKGLLNDKEKLSYEINNLFNILLKTLFPVVIICSILYKALWVLIFNVNYISEIIIFLIFSIFFLVLYCVFLQILSLFNDYKSLLSSVLISVLFKLIMTIPCINSFYMMGYNQVFGEIFSTIISYILGMIVIIIILSRKYHINFVDNFPKILNLIYNNIILTLILLFLSLVLPIKAIDPLNSLISIIIYSVVGSLLFIIKISLDKLVFEKKRLS